MALVLMYFVIKGYISCSEGLVHHKNGADSRHQGRAESHGMLSGAESFLLEVRRKGVAAVSTSEESRAFLMDPRGRGSPRKPEENTDLSTSPGPTSTCRTTAPLRCLDDLGRQCSCGGREAGGGACVASPEVGLFRQRGALRDQGVLPPNPEADLHRNPRPTQAAALFPRPPYHGGLVLPPGRDNPE